MMQVATSFLQGQEAASNQERKKVPPAWRHQEGGHRQNFKKGGGFRSQHKQEKRPDRFTLLTKTPKEILALEKGKFKTPPPMTTPVEKRNANKFCEFHGEVGHNTDECNHLRKQIEDMLKAGKLSHIIRELKQSSGKEQPKKKGEASGKEKPQAILMIQSRQKVIRQKITQSFSPNSEMLFPHLRDDEGAEGPLIIEAEIGGHQVHRICVDGGSSFEILYEHCFNRLRPEIKNQMVPATTSLIGFSGEIKWPLGQITLLVKIGDDEHSTSAWMDFMVVRSTLHGYDLGQEDNSSGRSNLCGDSPSNASWPLTRGKPNTIWQRKHVERPRSDYKPSRTEDEIVRDIEETFKTLKKINMKLNLKKCTFGVEEGMFLGYQVNTKGIRIFPDKVDAVLSLQSPKCLKDVQKLNGKLASLNSDFLWTEEAEAAFKQMKEHIAKLPMLTAPEEQEELIVLYLAASKEAYHASKKLRRYFQAHPITVITDQPIKNILSNPEVAGQMQKWSIQLGEFGIHYRPRVSVKGQVLANFIVERPEDEGQDNSARRRTAPSTVDLLVHGRIILRRRMRSRSDTHGSIGTGLRIAEKMGVRNLEVNVDSKLVANQVNGTYIAKEADMIKYLEKVRTLTSTFRAFSIKQVPRSKNKGRRCTEQIGVTSFEHLNKLGPSQANYILREIHEGSFVAMKCGYTLRLSSKAIDGTRDITGLT
ncbi:reverse transcriptase domain-containing protein [Tanacetum coccineum]